MAALRGMAVGRVYPEFRIEDRKYTAKGPFGKNGTVPLNDCICCEDSRMEKGS